MNHTQRDLDSVSSDEIYTFLETLTQDLTKSTRRLRYAQLKSFYNSIIDQCLPLNRTIFLLHPGDCSPPLYVMSKIIVLSRFSFMMSPFF
jgi:hypothetical protein